MLRSGQVQWRTQGKVEVSLKGIPESRNMGLGGLVLDFPSLLYKGLRILMFQLSGVYCILMLI